MWHSPDHTLPAEREWVIGAWHAPEEFAKRVADCRLHLTKRIGQRWFDWEGCECGTPPVQWTHRPNL